MTIRGIIESPAMTRMFLGGSCSSFDDVRARKGTGILPIECKMEVAQTKAVAMRAASLFDTVLGTLHADLALKVAICSNVVLNKTCWRDRHATT